MAQTTNRKCSCVRRFNYVCLNCLEARGDYRRPDWDTWTAQIVELGRAAAARK